MFIGLPSTSKAKFMRAVPLLIIVFLFCSFMACCQKGAIPEPSTNSHRRSETSLLFVGNSLTYTNNLPDLVAQIGQRNGYKIITEMLAYPNYALEDHWRDGQLQRLIKSGNYDFVIVQQGPSSQEEGRAMLLNDGARIKTLCQEYDTELAFFMVWPARSNYYMFEGVIRNYTDAATQTQSKLCPVGQRWKEYFDATNDFSYYGADMFHPSEKGSEVAAQIIYETLFK